MRANRKCGQIGPADRQKQKGRCVARHRGKDGDVLYCREWGAGHCGPLTRPEVKLRLSQIAKKQLVGDLLFQECRKANHRYRPEATEDDPFACRRCNIASGKTEPEKRVGRQIKQALKPDVPQLEENGRHHPERQAKACPTPQDTIGRVANRGQFNFRGRKRGFARCELVVEHGRQPCRAWSDLAGPTCGVR